MRILRCHREWRTVRQLHEIQLMYYCAVSRYQRPWTPKRLNRLNLLHRTIEQPHGTGNSRHLIG